MLLSEWNHYFISERFGLLFVDIVDVDCRTTWEFQGWNRFILRSVMHLEKRGRLLCRNYKVEKLGCNASLVLKIMLPAWWFCGRSTRPSKVTSSRLDTVSDSGRSVIWCESGGLRDLVPWNILGTFRSLYRKNQQFNTIWWRN